MGCRSVSLFLLKGLIAGLSGLVLCCHIVQVILLAQRDDTGNWWPQFVPYTLYYVQSIVSIMSVTMLLLLYCFQTNTLWSDRILSIINFLLFVAIIVYISLKSGMVPWLGDVPRPFYSDAKGWVPYCSDYSDSLTSIRCWLLNGAWLAMILSGLSWLALALYTVILRNTYKYNKNDYDAYDYKNDIPMATAAARNSTYPEEQQQPYSPYINQEEQHLRHASKSPL